MAKKPKKPFLAQSKVARAIADYPGASPQQRKMAFSAYGNEIRRRQVAGDRIDRDGDRDPRLDDARRTDIADAQARMAGLRIGAIQPAQKEGVRAIGRVKTGQYSPLGNLSPAPSSRKDTMKTSLGLGKSPMQGSGLPYPVGYKES